MALSINTGITLNYKLNLTQSMRESLNILQMNSVDLQDLLIEEIAQNPAIEKIDYKSLDNDPFIENYSNESGFQEIIENMAKSETLFDHLSSQASIHSLSDREYEAMIRVISALDDNGFLKVDLQELVDFDFSKQSVRVTSQKKLHILIMVVYF